MKYITKVLNVIHNLMRYLHFEGSYYEFNKMLKNYENDIVLDTCIKNNIISLISELNVEKEKQCLAILKNPGIPLEDLSLDYNISDLNDRELLVYLGIILYSVSIIEKDNFLLFKYNECIWNCGWHNYALECRGKIITRDTHEIVSYPFDKFFNLNEQKSTQESLVSVKISKAEKISLTNKLDGSTIIVSKHNGILLITTNGSFSNEQTEWAYEIFKEKYNYFISNIPNGYTFVFELIHPENRIILDYGDIRDVYLIAVRNNQLMEKGLVSYDELFKIANNWGLKIVEQDTFTTLEDICRKARELTNANKEGWVIRLENNEHVEFMFKLKLEEYFLLHRAKAHVSLKNIYNLLYLGNLPEFMNTVDNNTKQEIIDMLEDINICLGKIHNEVISRAEKIMNDLDIDSNTILETANKAKLLSTVDICKNDKLFGSYILAYIKTADINYACKKMRLSKFMAFYEYFQRH